jgi:hypothetical protein
MQTRSAVGPEGLKTAGRCQPVGRPRLAQSLTSVSSITVGSVAVSECGAPGVM